MSIVIYQPETRRGHGAKMIMTVLVWGNNTKRYVDCVLYFVKLTNSQISLHVSGCQIGRCLVVIARPGTKNWYRDGYSKNEDFCREKLQIFGSTTRIHPSLRHQILNRITINLTKAYWELKTMTSLPFLQKIIIKYLDIWGIYINSKIY